MKTIFLFLVLLSTSILLSCNSDDDSPSNIYENCCNTPPVERDFNPGKVYIPNIFTPNFDGINDVFLVFADDGIDKIKEIRISNDAGEMLFEYFNFLPNDVFYGWVPVENGMTTHKGLFTYSVKLQNTNGEDFEITGTACSFICEEGNPLMNFDNCGFPVQHDGGGGFDPFLPNLEADCP